ncbi:MAG TPA: 1,4-dihydroxy-2-naphthoate polyprenyltransferase [Acidimicrobiia bacterium]|jgi:1,4-dihydroxy-2-naphthoate octaprenyltransferase|nr:1,4-dihydroxy-2-naphthoate polyprenyltransferase [Acidimicrobiia bacterium]
MNVWLAGARPRTLPASVSPVLVGTAVAAAQGTVVAWRALAAMVVALALQVGTNYANDYSDGRRGTDARRAGPQRLTASGLVPPALVLRAAALAFAVAALAGLALAVAVDLRLLVVGAACIAAGALYTGGPKPYGYSGFGELAVLVFFGFVATAGSAYVQLERLTGLALLASVPVGLLACALLVANNLRDVDTDAESKKLTLAVRLGAARTRVLYQASLVGAVAGVVAVGATRPPALVALAATPLALVPARLVAQRRDAPGLIAALGATARLQLVTCALLAAGLWLS